jgi:hypothetical protein
VKQPAQRRVIALNIDGFDFDLARRLISEGKMRGLSWCIENSAQFHLEQGFERRGRDTGMTGEHICTGRGPETTDRWGPFFFDKNSYRCVQKFSQETPYLAQMTQKTVVLDATYFNLDECPNTVGMVGWSGHDPGAPQRCRPEGLKQEIEDVFGPPALSLSDLYKQVYNHPDHALDYGVRLASMVRKRFQIASWMLNERFPDWDMALLSVEETHDAIEQLAHGLVDEHPMASHPSAKGAGVGLELVYEAVSEEIEKFVKSFPDAYFAIYAMHGMNLNKTDVPSMVLLPELLCRAEKGFKVFQPRKDWMDDDIAIVTPGEDWSQAVLQRLVFPPHTRAIKLAERGLLLGYKVVRKVIRSATGKIIGSDGLAEDEVHAGWIPAWQYKRYWPSMRAFALPSLHDGCVRINLIGREAQGKVALADYDRTVDEIVEMVTACRSPIDGLSVVEKVFIANRADPLSLNYSQSDIRFSWRRQLNLGFDHPEFGLIGPAPVHRTGGHTGQDGALLLMNIGLKPGDYGRRSAYDVPPTVVELMGAHIQNSMQGRSVVKRTADKTVVLNSEFSETLPR